MGTHQCTFCPPGTPLALDNGSSGDTVLVFKDGGVWEVPDLIKHYIGEHHWLPPGKFIADVMSREINLAAIRTRLPAERIGYLEGKFETGDVPTGFLEKLARAMQIADLAGNRKQYRGG